jgi:hypothetical protein
MYDLLYLADNANVPTDKPTSTARKGEKWYRQVSTGDVVNLLITENLKNFGRAAIIKTELVTYKDVIDRAGENHVAYGAKVAKGRAAADVLAEELESAYGPNEPTDAYTILSILPVRY